MAKQVAVIGSGPAGLACAQQLVRVGYDVVVFEKADRLGGLLRYGIPGFRLEKSVPDRGLIEHMQLGLDARGNVSASDKDYQTTLNGVFACGDMRRGQSLVVWAIREGRQCARAVDICLSGASVLPRV